MRIIDPQMRMKTMFDKRGSNERRKTKDNNNKVNDVKRGTQASVSIVKKVYKDRQTQGEVLLKHCSNMV
jgi:hypothetical protein